MTIKRNTFLSKGISFFLKLKKPLEKILSKGFLNLTVIDF